MPTEDRRQAERRQRRMSEAPLHYRCAACPFTGGEDAMIDHAQATGHMMTTDEDEARLADDGCPHVD